MAQKTWAAGPFELIRVNHPNHSCITTRGIRKAWGLQVKSFYIHCQTFRNRRAFEFSIVPHFPWRGKLYSLSFILHKLKKGGRIVLHNDKEPNQLWRWHLIALVWRAKKGGDLTIAEVDYNKNPRTLRQSGRFVLFRPDLLRHWVTPVESGTRITVGWMLFAIDAKKQEEAVE